MSLETITKRLKIISDINADLNKIKEALTESMENDPAFQEMEEEAKKIKEETKEKREKVKSNPTVKAMEDQAKELKEDLKEHKEVLAQELADYYKESGSLEIVDDEGNTKRIIFSAKLVNQ